MTQRLSRRPAAESALDLNQSHEKCRLPVRSRLGVSFRIGIREGTKKGVIGII
jgi:hypothetical protein